MAETFRAIFHGAKELEDALDQLPKSVARSVLVKAMMNAAQPVIHHARALCPVDTGDLAASIDVRTTLTKRQRRGRGFRLPSVFIGPSWPKGAHGHLIEFGTVKMRARPFLRPAWDAGKARVLDSMRREIWKALAAAARRLSQRAEAGKLSAKQISKLSR
jgi:HK97 gp10 family phage protein